MPQGRPKSETASLRKPQPKKLGLSVPPLLRLPHEELIRPLQPGEGGLHTESPSDLASSTETRQRAIEISQADSASLATLDGAKTASLAETDALGLQIASLANSARLANPAGLAGQASTISLMDSLPDTTGFTKL